MDSVKKVAWWGTVIVSGFIGIAGLGYLFERHVTQTDINVYHKRAKINKEMSKHLPYRVQEKLYSLIEAGQKAQMKEDYKKAVEKFTAALNFLKELNFEDPKTLAEVTFAKAVAHKKLNQLEEAAYFTQIAIRIHEQHTNEFELPFKVDTYFTLADTCLALEKYAESEKLFQKSADLLKQIQNADIKLMMFPIIYDGLSNAQHKLKNYSSALVSNLKALNGMVKFGLTSPMCTISFKRLKNIALNQQDGKIPEDIGKILKQKAEKVFENEEISLVHIFLFLALDAFYAQKFKECEELLDTVLSTFKNTKNTPSFSISEAMALQMANYQALNEKEKSEHCLHELVRIASTQGIMNISNFSQLFDIGACFVNYEPMEGKSFEVNYCLRVEKKEEKKEEKKPLSLKFSFEDPSNHIPLTLITPLTSKSMEIKSPNFKFIQRKTYVITMEVFQDESQSKLLEVVTILIPSLVDTSNIDNLDEVYDKMNAILQGNPPPEDNNPNDVIGGLD